MSDPSAARPSFYRDPVFRRLFAHVLAHKPVLMVAFAAMAITAATEPLMAKLTGVLLDQGFYQKDAAAGIWVPLAFVGLFLLRGLSTFASSFLLTRVSQAVLIELRASMFERMLQWPQATLEATPSGIVISKFINEASNALNLAAEVMTTAVRDTLTVAALLAVLLYYNWQLTLAILVIAPLIAMVLRTFSARLRRLNLENQAMLGEMTRAVQEAHEGARVIKVYEGYGYEHDRFAGINGKLRRFALKMQVAWSAGTPVTQIDRGHRAVRRHQHGAVAGADRAVIARRLHHLSHRRLAAAAAAAPPGGAQWPAGADAGGGRKRVRGDRFRHRRRSRQPDHRARARTDRVCRCRASAIPASRRPRSSHIDLEVAPGEMIALVGPSGAGKTTLINLIPRFVNPTSGVLRIDEHRHSGTELGGPAPADGAGVAGRGAL